MRNANFQIVFDESDDQWLTIRDVGPWDQFPTVTNDAEGVVLGLAQLGELTPGRRLRYYDSEGDLAELVYQGDRFVQFGFLTRPSSAAAPTEP
jgi:hypothetical protein